VVTRVASTSFPNKLRPQRNIDLSGVRAFETNRVTGGARLMIVILEFFGRRPGENDPVVLATEKIHFETVKAAILYAQGALNNVVFGGIAAEGCLVKTRQGALICALSPHTARSR
jgi:hypothetical protein